MKRYSSFSNFQVLGRVVHTFRTGLGSSWKLVSRMMLEEGLGTMGAEGLIQFELEQWYPLPGHLRALDRVLRDLGEVAIRQMAVTVPQVTRRLESPPTDVRTALTQVNMEYHMNHARDGRPMYSERTGELLAGIGHYRVYSGASVREARVECTNPYPCVFDQALLLSSAQKFNASAILVHLDSGSCRARGFPRCTYGVRWT